MRIVVISDAHCGKDRIGKAAVTPERWDAPLHEAVDYAIEHEVDLVLFNGDEQDSRAPYPSTYQRFANVLNRLDQENIPWRIVGGNHTIGAGKDYVSSLTPFRMLNDDAVIEGAVALHKVGNLNLLAIPWIRAVDYGIDATGLTIDEEIAVTRIEVLSRIEKIFADIDPSVPTLICGHLMLSTGNIDLAAPPVFLGKDVPIPLKALERYGVPISVGHIHHPVGPYVGSTQPTDFGDAGDVKSFTVLTHDDQASPSWYRERIPYKTSLKVADIRVHADKSATVIGEARKEAIQRITIETDCPLDQFEVRQRYEEWGPIESITVERERHVTARVDTEEALVAMNPLDAADIWLMSRDGRDAEDDLEALNRFKSLVEAEE